MAWGPIYNSFDRKYEDLHPQDVMVDYINRVGLYLLDVGIYMYLLVLVVVFVKKNSFLLFAKIFENFVLPVFTS